MKYLFIVTSSICSPLPSVYNKDQRFSQTLKTIESIRKYCSNSTIILIDNSGVSEYEEKIKEVVDFFLTSADNPSKSGGELSLINFAIQFVKNNNIPYDVLYKISGRYCLNDKFKPTIDTRISFRRYPSLVCTVLYSVGKEYEDDFLKILSDCFTGGIYIDIEHTLFNHIVNMNINWLDYLGVGGNIAPCGTYVEF